MKNLFIVLIILLLSGCFIFSQSPLNIVWETHYRAESIRFLQVNNIIEKDDRYILVIEGQNPNKALKNPGVVEIDKQGNILKGVSTVLDRNLLPHTVFEKDNQYKYFAHHNSKIYFFTSTLYGDSISVEKYEMPGNLYATSTPLILNDIIIQHITDFETLDGYFFYFNEYYEKIDELKIEKPKTDKYLIPYPYTSIEPEKNEFLMMFYGPTFNIKATFQYFVMVALDLEGKIKWETEFSLPNEREFFLFGFFREKNGNITIPYMTEISSKKEFYFLTLDASGNIISNNTITHDMSDNFSTFFRSLSNDRIACYGYKPFEGKLDNPIRFLKIFNRSGELLENFEWKDNLYIGNIFESKFGKIILTSTIKDTLTIMEINDKSTSIHSSDNYANEFGLSIHPNPATDYIYINLNDLGRDSSPSYNTGSGSVKIFNTLGQCVSHLTPTLSKGEGVRIDVSYLPPGVYLVRVGNRVEKFVKR